MDSFVPVRLGVSVQRRKHNWKDNLCMILHEIDEVFVIPVIQSSFSDLKMRRRDTTSELREKRAHDFRELFVLDNVQDLLQLVQEHHFFWRVRFRPEFEQPVDHWGGKSRIFFQKLDDAVRKL